MKQGQKRTLLSSRSWRQIFTLPEQTDDYKLMIINLLHNSSHDNIIWERNFLSDDLINGWLIKKGGRNEMIRDVEIIFNISS